MKEKVCFLVSEHPFLDARIFKKEAKSLLKKGYDVTLIVPRKKGFLFDIDGKEFTNDFLSPTFIHEGIKVITYEQVNFENKIKTLHYNIKTGRFHRFTDPLTKIGISQEADVYHAHEFFSFYSGIGIKRSLLSKGKQVKLIYDSHELVPDPKLLESESKKQLMKQILKLMIKEVDHVITVSESIKSRYLSMNNQLPIEVIFNSPPLTPDYVPKCYEKNEALIAYEGVVNRNKGSIKKLMDIVEISNKQFNLKAKIIGGSSHNQTERYLTIPSHLENKIELSGWVPYERIPGAMRNVDIGWIDLDSKNSLNNEFAMPNKFFSYLNNGVPVMVNKCKDMEDFITTHKCGVVVNKINATGYDYADALTYLYQNKTKLQEMSRNARKVMEKYFSWGHMEERLFSVYERMLIRNEK